MSSLNIKQGSEAHFPEYPLASPSNNEIDLLNLIEVLWRPKKRSWRSFLRLPAQAC